ncbi:lipocalin family protein [Alistipes sp.]|uniref:lipocalin family protein n=1 Tax=Alistipes sp. TaxID=1872444 RepID=UPI003AEFC3F7
MKRFFKFALLSLVLTAFAACDDDKSYVDPGLEVTPHNLSGTWQLAEWNGQPLAQDSYVYLDLIRKDRKYKMYQNIDSFSSRLLTGTYNIDTDSRTGSVIYGIYDHGIGYWQHRYYVRDLTAERMTWVAVDDPEDISVYVRCASIPEDITAGYEEEKE